MEEAEVGAPEGKKVTLSLLRNECLYSLLCHLFALPISCDKLIFHEIKQGQSSETACVEPVVCMMHTYRFTISRSVRPLTQPIQLSRASRPRYGEMLRALALSCCAARSQPAAFSAGRGFVGGAMSVCAQARRETHTRSWSGWWRFNHQIHTSRRSSGVHSPGLRSAWNCRTQTLVAPCGGGAKAKRLLGRRH